MADGGLSALPFGLRHADSLQTTLAVQEWLGKGIAIVLWGLTAQELSEGYNSPLASVAGSVLFVMGCWLALFGQHQLASLYRRKRCERLLGGGGVVGFLGRVQPQPSTFQGESFLRMSPQRLTVASDRSLPESLRRSIDGSPDPASLRRSSWPEAPGRRRWWSVSIVGNAGTWTVTASREYLEALLAAGPFHPH